ncbi:MAG TPA: propanediol/glycerol family dehydratase large subunit, partial [Candidatus Ligilactobacillus excrementavium]|nr:propanediol/glycerol family dehydratase large subunit [Candidatus Ligilactobacillus excrementavium]
GATVVDIIKALNEGGLSEVADSVLHLAEQKITGDYLQTSAVFGKDWNCISAINDNNDYEGPGTGYRLWKDQEKWDKIKDISWAVDPQNMKDYMN